MKELVVISGKGGTGKTSLVASFAALAPNAVLADCDVDAADLHLILAPDIRRRTEFRSGHRASIRAENCVGCGRCAALCRFDAISETFRPSAGARAFAVDSSSCEGCGVCVWNCPANAIDFDEQVCGEWFVSGTRHGPMVHARLAPGAENSGKLVSLVREQARELANQEHRDLVLVDGPPGTGCPVIAALTGASGVLVVTEPTVSGAHDLARVLELANHFKIQAAICVNKWDIHPAQADHIESAARAAGATPVGRVRYDKAATAAQRQGLAVVEAGVSPLADDIRTVWNNWIGMNIP
ncbi:MAG: 4Fe-4S dicluster domain-containing protein [Opitutae bacterium]|nr:4Fe-4S dicluster domain-containing protein [Opitutae bacterium]